MGGRGGGLRDGSSCPESVNLLVAFATEEEGPDAVIGLAKRRGGVAKTGGVACASVGRLGRGKAAAAAAAAASSSSVFFLTVF